MEASIKPDIRELERKHKAYQLDMEYFAFHLKKLFEIMPAPDVIFDFNTGEWESKIKPEWQKRIDNILNERNKFVKERYPEFYNEKT